MEWIKVTDKTKIRADRFLVLLPNDLANDQYWPHIASRHFGSNIEFDIDELESCSGEWRLSDFAYYAYLYNQPERSKREDSQKCEMRCSEHCRNAVRDK
jgi:hypothetical protein